MTVFDTNVVACALLNDPTHGEEALAALAADADRAAPDVALDELANVMWMAVRHAGLGTAAARAALGRGRRLFSEIVPSEELWEDALDLAVGRDHSVYDTLFVAPAIRRRCRLVTEDRRLRERFPEVAVSIATWLGRA